MSFNQWTIQARGKLELHNLKCPIGPDQWDISTRRPALAAVRLLITNITSPEDPGLTADGLLQLTFGHMRILNHLPNNGKPSRPMLQLNCSQKYLPIGIGSERCESLRRHR